MANVPSCFVKYILFYIFFLYTAYAIVCPQNEVEVTCPSDPPCPSDSCPTGPRQTQNCPKFHSDICRASSCKCGFNYSRAKNGTCIPSRDCPPFPCPNVNEEYNPCPPACPTDDCSQATPTGNCPIIGRIGIVVPCKPDCRCKKNYWRKNGVCVPYAKCNKQNASSVATDDVCPPNSSPKDGIDCKSDCCPEPEGQSLCPDACATACKCDLMYRRAYNGTCIPSRDCPPISCPENEVFESCPVCSESCDNANPEGRRCPKFGNIKYTVICDPKCRCIDNYWRNSNGVCVPYDECCTC